MDAELARAWASVAPSLYAEPLGLVAPEAIVRGVPVVASAIGGFSETVAENRTGLLFRNGDERGLADCLLSVARGDAFPDRRVAPEFVAETARRHSLVAHVERMREILGSVRGGP